jgi:hypothetical protein
MPRKVYEPWITIRAFNLTDQQSCQAAILNCANCGKDMQIMIPDELNNLWAMSSAFGTIHNKCEAKEDNEA